MTILRHPKLCCLLFALAAAACTDSCSCNCPTKVVRDDAGDYSFVRQVVPLLHGRKIRGREETRLLADIIHATNSRAVVVNALMEDPQFVSSWSEHFVDQLRVNRAGHKNQSDCFATPLQAAPPPTLATFIRDHRADSGLGPAANFNMADVLVSSIQLDNVFPIYSAYLFAMENKPLQGNMVSEKNKRDDMASTFTRVYTHRKVGCLQCHRTDFSRTGPQSYWNRHHPIPANFEKAIFYDETDSSIAAEDKAHAQFRTDASFGGVTPWLRMTNCGTANSGVGQDPMGVSPYFTEAKLPMTIMDTHIYLHEGRRKLAMEGLRRSDPPECAICSQPQCTQPTPTEDPAVEAVFSNHGCFNCHSGGAGGLTMSSGHWAAALVQQPRTAGGTLRVAPGDPDHSFLIMKLTGNLQPGDGVRMPQVGQYLDNATIDVVRNWIQHLPPTTPPPPQCNVCSDGTCGGFPMQVNGRAAFAFLVAANIVDQTWAEVTGAPLTIANYFSRNDEQGLELWDLTEFFFVPQNWSLKKLLALIMTSDYFNRKASKFASAPNPYDMPKFFNPWSEADPRLPPVALPGWTPGHPPSPDPAYHPENHPENHKNAMSEQIHRYSPRSLLYSASAALGWPTPQRFYGSAYPSSDLAKAIGQFWRDAEPGFNEVDFQGLIQWESIQGSCVNRSSGPDWINRLMTAIASYNQSHVGAELTRSQTISVLKDWLASDGQISNTAPSGSTQTEQSALEALFGALSGRTDTSTPQAVAELDGKLRQYCGVLLESPHFMLAGVAPMDLGPALSLRVCNDSNDCTYQQMCQHIQSAVAAQGFNLNCNADPVTIAPTPPPFPKVALRDICTLIPCRVLPYDGLDECFTQKLPPETCLPRRPPGCDPRCTGFGCCGGPGTEVLDPRQPSYILAWAEGQKVKVAQDVRVRRAGDLRAEGFQTLQAGSTLAAGDVLEIPPKGKLEISAGKGSFRTPADGLPEHGPYRNWYVVITGDSVLRKAAHPPFQWQLTSQQIENDRIRREADDRYRIPENIRTKHSDEVRQSKKSK